jgi:hypothetical protein
MTFFKAYRCENYPYKPYKDLYTNIHISMEIASMRFQTRNLLLRSNFHINPITGLKT